MLLHMVGKYEGAEEDDLTAFGKAQF